MVLDCGFDFLRLNADVSLRSGGRTMLQQPLHQRDVVIVFVVDLRCIPLTETVGGDSLEVQMVISVGGDSVFLILFLINPTIAL